MTMDTTDHLESFRKQWKQELVSKSRKDTPSLGHREQNLETGNFNPFPSQSSNGPAPGASFSGQLHQNDNCKETVSKEPLVKDADPLFILPQGSSHSSSSTYRPFSIVGDLLKQHDKQAEDKTILNDVKTVNSRKRTRQRDLEKRQNKQLKLVRLKDIFVTQQEAEIPSERLLDKLISDIDEITEIPFFDINLPRELAVQIFQYLSMKDLCNCAQVSKSWGSLAEDELLWCKICHGLGREKIYMTREKTNWKQIVRHNVERQRTLVTNWKSRTGKLSCLEHVRGKILTTVHSQGNTVVAGYTNGEVKLWDLSSGDNCVFQPSSTSLVIDENVDGVQSNMVHSVLTAGGTTVAAFTQGNIDIWNFESGTQPIQKYTLPAGNQHVIPNMCLSQDGDTLVTSYKRFIDILHREDGSHGDLEFCKIHELDAEANVKNIKLYPNDCDLPTVIYSRHNSVRLYTLTKRGTGYTGHMTEVHNMFGAPVDMVDYKTEQAVIGVALGPESWGGLDDGLKVKVYDMKTCKLLQTLEGHCWKLSCINMMDSPVNELVTGSLDKHVRVFDIRVKCTIQSFLHTLPVYQVQMDEWKVVAGGEDGFLLVWDRRMGNKLWELHNRHPVRYMHFEDKTLIAANISHSKEPEVDEFDIAVHRRYRGCINVYNFLEDLTTKDVPEICLSTYDQPDASKYNISLAVPYDTLNF